MTWISRRWRRRLLVAAGACLGAVLAPNMLWLTRSTARIENRTDLTLESFQVQGGSTFTPPADLAPRSRRFLLLPVQGEATFSVRFRIAGAEYDGCREYVEGQMYHVRVNVEPGPAISCDTILPRVSPLLVFEVLRNNGRPATAAEHRSDSVCKEKNSETSGGSNAHSMSGGRCVAHRRDGAGRTAGE